MPKDKRRQLPTEIRQARVKGRCKLHLHLKPSVL